MTASDSHDTNLVGNVESVLVASKGNVSLLLTSGGVEGVDLSNLELVERLASLLDHFLVGSFVHDEYKSVVVLNGLDGRFAAKWVLDDSELVEGVVSSYSSQKDLGSSLLNRSLGLFECGSRPNLGFSGGVSALLDGIGCLLCCNLSSLWHIPY